MDRHQFLHSNSMRALRNIEPRSIECLECEYMCLLCVQMLERQNDEMADKLADKVQMLKQVSRMHSTSATYSSD